MLAFKREVAQVLTTGGYELAGKTGKEHDVWVHPDGSRPAIHVPGTPRDPDFALVRIQRAVRKGTTPHIPTGSEFAMAGTRSNQTEMPLAEKLVRAAPPALARRAANPNERIPAKVEDLGAWMRKCIQSHGALPGSALRAAATELRLSPEQMSQARKEAGAGSYRLAGAGATSDETYTDFVKRIPADAHVFVGRSRKGARRVAPVIKSNLNDLPTDPDEERGRPLVGGDLTPAQREKAQTMMRESTERADAEIAERRLTTQQAIESIAMNGNGKHVPAGMQAALELLMQTAIEETHAVTPEDIATLKSYSDNLIAMQGTMLAMQRGITKMVERLAKPAVEPA